MGRAQLEMLKRRRTKIIATLGPASSDRETIARLIAAGVNVVRLNMSHGNHEGHAAAYELVRAAAHEARNPIGVLADLSGPKIRVGQFKGGAIELVPGSPVMVTTRDVEGGPDLVPSQYVTLHEELSPGGRILLADGAFELRVESIDGTEISCQVIRGGLLKDRKGMNLPDARLSAPALTEKDRIDAAFALDLGVDYLALSFVRHTDDVEELRALLPADGPRIIAKIERPESLDCIEDIVEAADGIMVARGDLGVELPPEEVPVVQRQLVALSRARNKPCIVATQMLESMIESSQPTRAEVSDVSTAVFSGADAVMLSAETASGEHPVDAVQMMDRIARVAEAHMFATNRFDGDTGEAAPGSPLPKAVARSTAQLSRDLGLRAIVVLPSDGAGTTARIMAAARPGSPVVGVASTLKGMWQMSLLWGVIPRLVKPDELEDPSSLARGLAVQLDLAEPGHRVLCVEGFRDGDAPDAPRITVLTI